MINTGSREIVEKSKVPHNKQHDAPQGTFRSNIREEMPRKTLLEPTKKSDSVLMALHQTQRVTNLNPRQSLPPTSKRIGSSVSNSLEPRDISPDITSSRRTDSKQSLMSFVTASPGNETSRTYYSSSVTNTSNFSMNDSDANNPKSRSGTPVLKSSVLAVNMLSAEEVISYGDQKDEEPLLPSAPIASNIREDSQNSNGSNLTATERRMQAKESVRELDEFFISEAFLTARSRSTEPPQRASRALPPLSPRKNNTGNVSQGPTSISPSNRNKIGSSNESSFHTQSDTNSLSNIDEKKEIKQTEVEPKICSTEPEVITSNDSLHEHNHIKGSSSINGTTIKGSTLRGKKFLKATSLSSTTVDGAKISKKNPLNHDRMDTASSRLRAAASEARLRRIAMSRSPPKMRSKDHLKAMVVEKNHRTYLKPRNDSIINSSNQQDAVTGTRDDRSTNLQSDLDNEIISTVIEGRAGIKTRANASTSSESSLSVNEHSERLTTNCNDTKLLSNRNASGIANMLESSNNFDTNLAVGEGIGSPGSGGANDEACSEITYTDLGGGNSASYDDIDNQSIGSTASSLPSIHLVIYNYL